MKILFVCLGNICRSPMAEAILKDMVKKEQLNIEVYSAGTSGYHNGEKAHVGTLNELKKHEISTEGLISSQLKKEDGQIYDYIIAMDDQNLKDIHKILNNIHPKCIVRKLLNKNVPDPWYDNNFEQTYKLCYEGCTKLLKEIRTKIN